MKLGIVWNSMNIRRYESECRRLSEQNELLAKRLSFLSRAVDLQTSDGAFCSETCIFLPHCEMTVNAGGCVNSWIKGAETENYLLRHMGDDGE